MFIQPFITGITFKSNVKRTFSIFNGNAFQLWLIRVSFCIGTRRKTSLRTFFITNGQCSQAVVRRQIILTFLDLYINFYDACLYRNQFSIFIYLRILIRRFLFIQPTDFIGTFSFRFLIKHNRKRLPYNCFLFPIICHFRHRLVNFKCFRQLPGISSYTFYTNQRRTCIDIILITYCKIRTLNQILAGVGYYRNLRTFCLPVINAEVTGIHSDQKSTDIDRCRILSGISTSTSRITVRIFLGITAGWPIVSGRTIISGRWIIVWRITTASGRILILTKKFFPQLPNQILFCPWICPGTARVRCRILCLCCIRWRFRPCHWNLLFAAPGTVFFLLFLCDKTPYTHIIRNCFQFLKRNRFNRSPCHFTPYILFKFFICTYLNLSLRLLWYLFI